MNFFDAILYQPLLNVLVVLYQFLGDFGFAVIALTVIIRVLLYPLAAEAIRTQKITAAIQPKMKEIQEKYKNDKEKQALMMMELWREHKFNPLSGLFFLLIQFPVLLTLYFLFQNGFKDGALDMLYGFVPNPGKINPSFLGVVDLSQSVPVFAILAGGLQFVQTKMMTPKIPPSNNKEKSQSERFNEILQKEMLYIFPLFTVWIFWFMPSALGLYWVVTSIFSIIQQHFILKANN